MSEESYPEAGEEKRDGTSKVLIAIGAVAAVVILICCVVFAMLTILGPQIGNVFSQITFTLENPPPAVILPLW